jgi:hypothetical protein
VIEKIVEKIIMNLPSQEKAHKTIQVGCFFDDESGTRLGFMQLTSYGLIEDCLQIHYHL